MAGQVSSLDAVKKILAGGSMPGETGKGDRKRYKLPDGTDEVRLRILPQKDDPTFPLRISIYHYDMPGVSKSDREKERDAKSGNSKGASIKCLQMFGLECPICKTLKKYEGKAELEDWVGRISGIANVLVKEDPTQRVDARVPHITYFSIGIVKWFEKIFQSEDGQALVNLKNGYDVIIHRKKYKGAFEIRTGLTGSPLADDPKKTKDIMAQAYNLAEIAGKADDNMVTRAKEAARCLEAEIEAQIAAKAELATDTDGGVASFDPDEQVPEFSDENTETEAEGTETEEEEETAENESPAIVQHNKEAKKNAAKAPPKGAAGKGATKAAPKAADAKEAKGKAKPAAAAKKPAAAAITKPQGAPECFGDDSVHDSDSEQCLDCPHEFYCEAAIDKAKKG